MTLIAAAISSVDHKLHYLMMGPKYLKGSTIKTLTITPATNAAAGGDTLDLSAHFPNRVYWVKAMNPTAKNATTGYVQVGFVPGTAKTDNPGGWASTDWKVQFSEGATSKTGNIAAYVVYAVACGC
jgi:hypothetical protein